LIGAIGSGVLVDECGDGGVGDVWRTMVDCWHGLRAGEWCCRTRTDKGG